jgi:hypothetical protein
MPEVPLRTESAAATIAQAVTVAAGVFAPGHLGGGLPVCRLSWSMTSWSRPRRCSAGCAACLRGWGVLRAGAGVVPAAGLCPGVGEADRGPGWPAGGLPFGEGAARPAPPPGPGPAERPCSRWWPGRWPSRTLRGALWRDAHGRLRWLHFAEGPGHLGGLATRMPVSSSTCWRRTLTVPASVSMSQRRNADTSPQRKLAKAASSTTTRYRSSGIRAARSYTWRTVEPSRPAARCAGQTRNPRRDCSRRALA